MNSFQGNRANSGKNDGKRRDYLIQQEKLRSMAQSATTNKALDADSMIENLLSRSETFMKHKEAPNQGLPAWLNSNSSLLPKIYKSIWLSVRSKSATGPQQFCDTQFLTSILLTSGIPTENLGHIWALCNKTAPGMLTEQELYQVLALIASAQLGRLWNNLAVLQKLTEPIVPCLNYNLLAMSPPTADPGIHSTYLPNTMAMSIPSPVQMFQNTTNAVLSKKTSFELNPSLLESMLSSNFSQSEAASVTPPTPRKESDGDFSDNWTDFIDHTASATTKPVPSAIPKEPFPFLGDSPQKVSGISSMATLNTESLNIRLGPSSVSSISKEPFPFLGDSPQKISGSTNSILDIESPVSGGLNQPNLLDPGLYDFSSNVNVMSKPQLNDIADNFSSLTTTSKSSQKEKVDHGNDDEFTDFQSFDFPVTRAANKTQPKDKVTSNIESIMKINSDLYSKPVPTKTEGKNTFLSSESDEVVYGQKGYVVENPLYLSDNDSIYDSVSVNSLKFDTISVDAESNQGVAFSAPADKAKQSSSPLPGPFIQVPSLISANSSEDKYSVFRMLEMDENPPKQKTEQPVEDDDFGDFLTADVTHSAPQVKADKLSPQENILDSPSPTFLSEPIVGADQKMNVGYSQSQSLQETCVNACISVLRNAVGKFSSLNPDVLKLVLCEDKCIDYIQALTEIYRIAEKMVQSVNTGQYKDNLDNVWKDLNSFVSTKFSVEECEEENDYNCTLCNTSSGSAVIKYGTSYYHVPCINFYLNCVNSNLPD